MAAVGAWPVHWAPCSRRGARPVPLSLYGCLGGVADLIVHLWQPCGRGPSTGPCMAAVGAWPVPCTSYACNGGVAGPWCPYCRRGGVAGPPGPVWPPWGRGWSPGLRMVVVGRGWSPGPRMTTVGAWPVPWAPYGCRRGMAGPLRLVWPPWRRGQFNGPPMAAGGRGRSPGPRMAVMWEWPVPWASYGFRGGVAGPLFPVWQPWGCGRSPGPRMAAVGAWQSPGARIAAVGAWPVRSCLYGCHEGYPLSAVKAG